MIALWCHLWQKSFRDLGRGPAQVLVAEVLTGTSALAIYYFTSKALGPAVNFGGNYFLFLVVGEAGLFIPLALWNGVVTAVKNGASEGTLELWMTLPGNVSRLIALQALALVPREVFRFGLLLFTAYVGFGLRLPLAHAACLFLVGLAAIPLFLAGGAVAAALVLVFRRGLVATAHAGALGAVLAGAYFPISSFPPALRRLSQLFSPFTWALQLARQGVAQGPSPEFFAALGLLFAVGAVAGLGALTFLEGAFDRLRQRGEPLLFSE